MNTVSTPVPGRGAVRTILAWFRHCWQPLVGYELAFKVLMFLVATPLATWLFHLLIASSGEKSVANMEVLPFLLSSLGGITVVAAGALALVVRVAEEAGLEIIAARSRAGKRITALRALACVVRNFPALFGAALAEILVVLAWTAPVLALGGLLYFILQATHDINYYFKAWPPVFVAAVSVMSLLGVGLAAVLFRYFVLWTFVAPVCLFEGLTFFPALRRSARLVRGSFWRMVGIILAWAAGGSLAAGMIMAVLGIPAGWLAAGSGGKTNVALMALVGAGTLAAGGLLALFIMPLVCIVVLDLYFDVYRRQGWAVPEPARCARAPDLDAWGRVRLSRGAIAGLAAAVFLAGAMALGLYLGQTVREPDRTHVIAHRGDSAHAPENTLSALRQAIELKAEIAEIDVQETKDGVIMVLHDNDVMRVAGVPQGLWQMTFEEARRLDVGAWFSPAFKGEKLPTLEEVLELTRGRIRLIVELKYNGHADRLAERTVEVIRKMGAEDWCVISSLKYEGLQQVKAMESRLPTVYILFTCIGDVASRKADGFALQAAQVTPDFIRELHAKDKPAYVWTVDDPGDMEAFIEMGADYLYTNDPAALMALLQRRAAMSQGEKLGRKFKRLLDTALN